MGFGLCPGAGLAADFFHRRRRRADAVLAATLGGRGRNRVYDLDGPEALTLGEGARRLGSTLGQPVRIVRVPLGLCPLWPPRKVVGFGPYEAALMLEMLTEHGYHCDPAPARELLGREPMPVDVALREYYAGRQRTAWRDSLLGTLRLRTAEATTQGEAMLRWLINKRLATEETKLGVSLDYARYILRASLRAFLKFTKIIALAEYRRAMPKEPFYAARIVAARHDDCGECVQIAVNQARKAGIDASLLQAVLADRWDQLPAEIADACRFAAAVLSASGEEDELRERIRQRHGEEALVELALAIAVGRVFPATKRALGYAKSCSRVSIQV